jgi:hypothetical protein
MRSIFFFSLSILGWGGLTFNFIKEGNAWGAFFASLPFIAFVLFVLFPGRGPGFFAFAQKFGPAQKNDETERQYHLKMAKLWFIGALIFPVTYALAYVFEKYQGFVIVSVFAGILLGIPCFLKGIGSLYSAGKSKS